MGRAEVLSFARAYANLRVQGLAWLWLRLTYKVHLSLKEEDRLLTWQAGRTEHHCWYQTHGHPPYMLAYRMQQEILPEGYRQRACIVRDAHKRSWLHSWDLLCASPDDVTMAKSAVQGNYETFQSETGGALMNADKAILRIVKERSHQVKWPISAFVTFCKRRFPFSETVGQGLVTFSKRTWTKGAKGRRFLHSANGCFSIAAPGTRGSPGWAFATIGRPFARRLAATRHLPGVRNPAACGGGPSYLVFLPIAS